MDLCRRRGLGLYYIPAIKKSIGGENMQKSFQDMAIRASNAITDWRAMLADDGFSTEQADAILELYRREKIVKLDWGVGRYNVKHGAFLNKQTLQNALAIASK